jgi:predicted methyltransferase
MRRRQTWLMLVTFLALAEGCASREAHIAPATQPARGPSAAPGINDPYQNTDVGVWEERFETESREIYRERERIVALLNLESGEAVADIGAGTGLFTEPFSRAVGPAGRVYAVDIMPEFVRHIESRARSRGLTNVEAVLCRDDSVELPPDSVDVVFVCDTYHHFEYPARSLWSIHQALRSGGRMFVIDFKRIAGKSRPFILEHVRAGQEVFAEEIRAAGFEVREREDATFLEENYVLECRPLP